MREKINSNRIRHKTIVFFVIVMILLAGVTPALADYLGPNRTITETTTVCKVNLNECQYVPAKDIWKYKVVDNWACSNESKPWKAYPNQPSSQGCFDATAGDTYWEKVDIVQTVTNTYLPATIGSSLQNCTSSNGWCITAPQIILNGYEPVLGYTIIAIEGTLNGQTFACSNASCSVPLFEGDNNLAFWALSSWGDSSTMGTLNVKVDSVPPNITGTLSGTAGSNGWYLGQVSFNGSASDLTSGLATYTCALDGVVLGSCSSISINGDGAHTLALFSTDMAGNVRKLIKTASIDTQNPTLNAGLSGSQGSNNWYTSATLNATATDPTPGSGIAAFEYNLDNSSWLSFPSSGVLTLPEGKHTVDIRAVDNAGRAASASKSFWLDSAAPILTVNPIGTLGLSNWYTTDLSVTASATDETSGLDLFEYSLDGSNWTAYSTPLTLTDGVHTISFWAQDQAGLVKQTDRTYQVDMRSPQIAGNISGMIGSDDWYVSDVTLSASASDPVPGSGLDAFTFILDGAPSTPYTTSLNLTDGQHTIQFNAQDQAGLTNSIEQNIKIDTTHPDLTISTTLPNWIKNNFAISGTAGDNGSGLSKVEISLDNGQTWQPVTGATSWNYDWNTQTYADGSYTVQVRAIDKAGLGTEKTLNVGLDNHAPKINMPDSWLQWDTVTIDIWDDYSGLSDASIEISDPNDSQSKRVIKLDPQGFPLSFKWDRRFDDGSTAPFGTYDVKVNAIDYLGNVAQQNASVKILLTILPPGPTATVPPYTPHAATPTPSYVAPTATLIASPTATPTAVVRVFGAIDPTQQVLPTPTSVSTARATPTQSSVVEWVESIFVPTIDSNDQTVEIISSPGQSANNKTTDSQSNILWGAAAAAMVGAATTYAAEERRKQEEERARQAALEAQAEERHAKAQARHMDKMEAKREQEARWEEARLKQEQLEHAKEQKEKIDNNRAEQKDALIEKEINSYSAKPQEWKSSYNEYMAQKAEKEKEDKVKAAWAAYSNAQRQEDEVTTSKNQSWWDKAVNFIDKHQTATSLGIGAIVGIAAVGITLAVAATVSLPVILAAAGISALVAGVAVGTGTVILNNHFDRDPMTNVWSNIKAGAITAAVVTGIGLLLFGGAFTKAALTGGNTIAGWCSTHQATCSNVEPVLNAVDIGEQLWLSAKLAIQTETGNLAGAAETALELQMEYLDGGMPGNSVAKELGTEGLEKLAKYGDDAVYLIEKYGDDVIPLLVKYQDDALDIINAYDEEGIALLQQYGDDAIRLIKDHGSPAVKVLNAVDPESAQKLFDTLDDDVLNYATQQGNDALDALSRWSEDDLKEHGIELALRAKKDAQVLTDIRKLVASGHIDPKNLTEEQKALIKAIAANSTQYADEGQVVLGKWVDISNGFVERANETGSVHYNPHPDMWNLLGGLGSENQGEVAWLINQQVVQTGINKGLPFEYTLNGVPFEELENEHIAIQAIFSGQTDADILTALNKKVMPIRIKELQELQKAGYELVFDEINNSYIFTLP